MALLEIKYFMERTAGPNTPGTWHQVVTSVSSLSRVYTACNKKFHVHDDDPVKYGEPVEWDLYQDSLCACTKATVTADDLVNAARKLANQADGYSQA